MDNNFQHSSLGQKLKSMIAVDFRRMFTMKLFYIMAGISFAVPILILVMTTMMEGTVSVDPQTGIETVVQGFDSVWQMIGTVGESAAGMDMMSMCNINLLYFGFSVLVGLFVTEDFKSGYAKNLFTTRSGKNVYVVSKTFVCFVAGALMMAAFIIGTIMGGAISGLPFTLDSITTGNIGMCLLSKLLLIGVFVPIYLIASIVAKQKSWLAIAGSCMVGMLLFTMIPTLTPLKASGMNVIICVAGAFLFSIGFGAVSTLVLKKRDIL